MKKQTGSLISAFIFCAILGAGIYSCKKTETFTPPVQTMFVVTNTSGTYSIAAPGVVYKIPVGLTAVSGQDRTISIEVSSPTGAQLGTQFTISSSSITIPAGKVVDTLIIFGKYDEYLAGRKDTLKITLSGSDVETAAFNNTYTLLVSGPCFDGDISDINVIAGDFANTFENGGGYGPYTVTISNITQLTPTTGTATATNLYDSFGPININFDWTDPNNTIVTIPLQQTDQDYDVGQPFLIRTSPGLVSKFSVCNQTISLFIDVIVDNYPSPGSAAYYDKELDEVLSR